MKYRYLFFIIFISACGHKNNTGPQNGDSKIPEIRKEVSKKPVASYLVPMGDPKLDRKFGLEIYETPNTFKYLLAMQYDGMLQSDTLKVPDVGIWPVIEIKPGKEKLSCIIGFLDDKKEFREYKLLSAKNDQLNLTVLRRYVVDK